MNYGSTMRRWITYPTCLWAILFAAPHTWWALGIPAGFPGGEANHRLMMSTWRYFFDVLVVLLSAWTVLIAVTLLRPPHQVARRWISHTAAWIGAGMLLLRGIAGMIVDGRSRPNLVADLHGRWHPAGQRCLAGSRTKEESGGVFRLIASSPLLALAFDGSSSSAALTNDYH